MSDMIQRVLNMYQNENKSTYEIAEILNTYPNKIRRILKRSGCQLKDQSEAQRAAFSSGRREHPTKGRERTQEEKLKISASLSSRWDSLSKEEKKSRSDKAKENWKNLSASKKQEILQLASEGIRKAGKEGSKIEKYVYEKLIKSGFKTEFHKYNLIPNEKLEIDLYVSELKTIIEIDGPSHFLPVWGDEKLEKQMSADLDKNGLLLSKGFVIIRLKVLKNASLKRKEEVCNFIIESLKKIEDNFPPVSQRYIEVEI